MTENMSFAAFDVETANPKYASICAIGIAVVRNGRPAGAYSWLCRPPAGVGQFAWRNMQVHGISPDQVAGKPTFGQTLPEVTEVIADLPVIAHNASFDMSAVRQACELSRIPVPAWTYGCTKQWSQQLLRLPKHRLPDVVEALGIQLRDHHRADHDAIMAAEVTLGLARRIGAGTLTELAHAGGGPLRRLAPAAYR